MINVETFAEYVGETYETAARPGELTRALAMGSALVETALEDAWRPVPESVFDQCVLDVALAVYQRGNNNNGQYDTESPNGPVDPMMRVYPIIRKYVNRL